MSSNHTTCYEYRGAYRDLYAAMNNYLWDIDTLICLGDVEVSCYDAFINKNVLLGQFNKLKRAVSEVAREDADLKNAVEKFEKVLSNDGQAYLSILTMKEVND